MLLISPVAQKSKLFYSDVPLKKVGFLLTMQTVRRNVLSTTKTILVLVVKKDFDHK